MLPVPITLTSPITTVLKTGDCVDLTVTVGQEILYQVLSDVVSLEQKLFVG